MCPALLPASRAFAGGSRHGEKLATTSNDAQDNHSGFVRCPRERSGQCRHSTRIARVCLTVIPFPSKPLCLLLACNDVLKQPRRGSGYSAVRIALPECASSDPCPGSWSCARVADPLACSPNPVLPILRTLVSGCTPATHLTGIENSWGCNGRCSGDRTQRKLTKLICRGSAAARA
jgi:hypothetical protein